MEIKYIALIGILFLATGCSASSKPRENVPTSVMIQENQGEVQNSGETFHSYPCTQDCSGHKAGYDWAEKKGLNDTNDCEGNSNSFIEGCKSYVEENY